MTITKQDLIDLGCDPDHVDDWFIIRKDKGSKCLTGTAWLKITNQIDLAKLTIPQGVEACCEFEWRGFRADWYANKVTQGKGLRVAQIQPMTKREVVRESLRDINNTNW